MSDPAHALTLQFLAWVAEAPRTYAQAMDAWRSTCPRLSIWEDAILDGLVAFEGGATRNQSRVTLTPKGRARLGAQAAEMPHASAAAPQPLAYVAAK
jgi:hypothetical protein